MKCGNVLVIGNSGVGKSTLINSVLGENVAKTSWGVRGTTGELKIHESKEIPFRMIDTVGFEPGFFKEHKAIEAVKKWTRDCDKKGNEDTQINVIWFCVDGTAAKLFSNTIKNLSKATSTWKTVPIIVVITKSYSIPDRQNNIDMVNNAFALEKHHTKNLRKIIPVVASTFTLNEYAFAAPEGISELIDATNNLMPEGLKAAEKDLGRFRLNRRRFLAQTVVGVSASAGGAVGVLPLGVSDALLLKPIEIAEINSIARIYGITNNEDSKRFIRTIIEAGTVGVAAKAAIHALMMIPGINLGASIVNSVIAVSFVIALGEASTYAFEQIYLGKKSVSDIDWISKLIESKLSGDFIKKIEEAMKNFNSNTSKEEIPQVILSVLVGNQEKKHLLIHNLLINATALLSCNIWR